MGRLDWCIPLHLSMLSPSSCASRANCVLLEGSCCLWAGFEDYQEFTTSVQCVREFTLQRVMCNAPPAHVSLLSWCPTSGSSVLGSLSGTTCEMNFRVLAIAGGVTYQEPRLYRWRTWSISGNGCCPPFLLKCSIQGTLEPSISSSLAEAGQEDSQACSAWPSAAKPICLPGFSLRRLSQSRGWSFFVTLMTGCHSWEAYSFC